MAQVQRRVVLCDMDIATIVAEGGTAFTPSVQIPNGCTKITVQFKYHGIDYAFGCIMYQSLNSIDFDECRTIDEMPIQILMDIDSVSMTLNVSELLTTWIRFLVETGDCTTGTLDKFLVLFAA
jgi:hypothetical protein